MRYERLISTLMWFTKRLSERMPCNTEENLHRKNLCSSVIIVIWLWARWLVLDFWQTGKGIFFSLPPCPYWLWSSPCVMSSGHSGSFHGGEVTRAWRWPPTFV